MTPRDHQIRAINSLRQGYRDGHTRQVLQMPTGSGKTFVANLLLDKASARGKVAYFVVDRLPLVEQSARMFAEAGMRVGIVQSNHPGADPDAPVQVATVQTLARRQPPRMDFCIIDECHVLHRHHQKLMQDNPDVPFIGLSATPFSIGLGKHFTNLITVTSTADLIKDGLLVPYRAFAPSTPDLTGIKTVAGDYHKEQLGEAMDKPRLVGDVVDHWVKHGEGRQTLMFAVNIAHSKHMVHEMCSRGVAAEHIDAYTDSDERRRIINAFKAGDITALSSVGVLTTGFDAPNASCLVIARPTKSLMLHIQMLGRGLRTSPGKEDCLILDHAGNVLSLGMPDDPLPEELDDGTKKSRSRNKKDNKPLPKACSKCMYLKPAGVNTCPACGHTPDFRKDVQVVDGDLVSISGRNRNTTWDDKRRWAAGLKWIEQQRGYKSGWWARQYKERFGVWPNDPRVRHAAVEHPTLEMTAWVKHKQIKWARRRAA